MRRSGVGICVELIINLFKKVGALQNKKWAHKKKWAENVREEKGFFYNGRSKVPYLFFSLDKFIFVCFLRNSDE